MLSVGGGDITHPLIARRVERLLSFLEPEGEGLRRHSLKTGEQRTLPSTLEALEHSENFASPASLRIRFEERITHCVQRRHAHRSAMLCEQVKGMCHVFGVSAAQGRNGVTNVATASDHPLPFFVKGGRPR